MIDADVIVKVIQQRKWWRLGMFLSNRGHLSDRLCTYIVREAIQHCDKKSFECNILPHCAANEMDLVISYFTGRCWWQALSKLLQRGDLRDEQRRHIIEQVIMRGGNTCLYSSSLTVLSVN